MKCDEAGVSLDANDWHLGLIEPLGAEPGLPLTKAGHQLIRCVRECFEKNAQHACTINRQGEYPAQAMLNVRGMS